MKGNFTRDTFDQAKHFSRVLSQQGRVQVDADTNEQTAILLHYIRTLVKDIGGSYWGPAYPDKFGFEISSEYDENGKLVDEGNFKIGKGHYYVDGFLIENEKPMVYCSQAGFADRPLPESTKNYFAYLDVWERHITYIQDEHIRESALGGPDTCTRSQVVWQVKLSKTSAEGAGYDDVKQFIDTLPGLSQAVLKAHLCTDDNREVNACSVPPESRYRGTGNQLYRIEVHRSGKAWNGKMEKDNVSGNAAEAATFKWSRDNGSIVYQIVQQNGDVVKLQSLGFDQYTMLQEDNWVEIVDDDVELCGESGILAQVKSIDPLDLSVTLNLPEDAKEKLGDYEENSPKHPLLRRWDYQVLPKKPMSAGALLISESMEDWLRVEQGIEVQFQPGGEYRTGDYWLIPARVVTGEIEWSHEVDSDGNAVKDKPLALPPHGIEHHYAPLGVIENQKVTKLCRCKLKLSLDCTDVVPVTAGKKASLSKEVIKKGK